MKDVLLLIICLGLGFTVLLPDRIMIASDSRGNWLIYDDWSPFGCANYVGANIGYGVQFQAPHDCWVDSLAFHFYYVNGSGNAALFWLLDGNQSMPGDLRWSLYENAIVIGAWNKFPVDTEQTYFESDDWFYPFFILTGNSPALAYDNGCDYPDYMWSYSNNIFYNPSSPSGDWMIRAHVIEPAGIGEWISDAPHAYMFKTTTITSGEVKIEFTLLTATEAEILVYDIAGRQLATLASGRFSAGTHTVSTQLDLSCGIYFFNLKTESGINITRKFMFIK